MNRTQRRQLERQQAKQNNTFLDVKTKMYTYDELVKFSAIFHKQEMERIFQVYDKYMIYSPVCALASPPFNFGRKRIGTFVELFFSQIEALKNKTLDLETLEESARKSGVQISYNSEGHLTIDVDNEPRNAKLTPRIKVI